MPFVKQTKTFKGSDIIGVMEEVEEWMKQEGVGDADINLVVSVNPEKGVTAETDYYKDVDDIKWAILICPECGYWKTINKLPDIKNWSCPDCGGDDPYCFTEEDIKMGYEFVGRALSDDDKDFVHIYTEMCPTRQRLHDMLVKYHHFCKIGKFKNEHGDKIDRLYLKFNCFDGAPFLIDK